VERKCVVSYSLVSSSFPFLETIGIHKKVQKYIFNILYVHVKDTLLEQFYGYYVTYALMGLLKKNLFEWDVDDDDDVKAT